MKILLHICCAVCACSVVERLRQKGHQITGYFYNPNIQPPQEYQNRLQATEKLAREQNFPLLPAEYDDAEWFARIKGLEKEPEGGSRCAKCFAIRLEKAVAIAQENKFDAFTTTLSVSPHKNAKIINEIGQKIGNGLFLMYDFKKQNGFKRAQELSRRYNLYHQDYCGCLFSLEERKKYGKLHKKTCPVRHKSKAS